MGGGGGVGGVEKAGRTVSANWCKSIRRRSLRRGSQSGRSRRIEAAPERKTRRRSGGGREARRRRGQGRIITEAE